MYAVNNSLPQFFDLDGSPLNAGYLYFGKINQNPETNPIPVYFDAAGTQPAANIRTLNGYVFRSGAPAALYTGGGFSLTVKNKQGVSIYYAPYSSGLTDDLQWIVYAGAPTYISPTSFSVAGDQTGNFQVGRRVRTVNTGGTVYGTIQTSVFGGGITTGTVVNDSGVLDAGLSQVSYSLISVTNTSISRKMLGLPDLNTAFLSGASFGQTAGGPLEATFAGEVYDYGNRFNPATGRYTIPAGGDGLYEFAVSVQGNTNAGDGVLGILRRNGATTGNSNPAACMSPSTISGATLASNPYGTSVVSLPLVAGDYVSVFMSVLGGHNAGVQAFGGKQISQ